MSSTKTSRLTLSFRSNSLKSLVSIDLSGNPSIYFDFNETDFKPPAFKRVKMRNTSVETILLVRSWLNATQIESIDLSDNDLHLNVTTAAIFGQLVNLRELYLSNIRLDTMTLLHLDKLTQLVQLDLSSNSLANVSCSLIKSLGLLQNLDLSNNRLSSVDDCLLNKDKLTNLLLANNQISSLGANKFAVLIDVDLSRNQFEKFPVFSFDPIEYSHLDKLRTLDLSWNRIRELPELSEMIKLKSLVRLELSHNLIERLDDHLFETFLNLEYVSFAYNQLTFIASGTLDGLISLKYLNLSSNPIVDIAPGSFDAFDKLILLNLSSVNLPRLDIDMLSGLVNLKDFYFENNSNITIEAVFLAICILIFFNN